MDYFWRVGEGTTVFGCIAFRLECLSDESIMLPWRISLDGPILVPSRWHLFGTGDVDGFLPEALLLEDTLRTERELRWSSTLCFT